MRFDDLLGSPRWEILQFIAKKPMSPIELAEKLNTTVSYVSQQLKLLDAAGLVLKEKTGAVEKGKPRTLFTISNEVFYLTYLTKNFSGKKLIPLNEYHKSVLAIWMIEDVSLHLYFEKLFWKLQDNLDDVGGIFIDNSSNVPKMLILSDSNKLQSIIEIYVKTFARKINYTFLKTSSLNKISLDNVSLLYAKPNFLEMLQGGRDL